MSLILEMYFFCFSTNKIINKCKLSFLDKIIEINSNKLTFHIPENIFIHGKDKIVVNLTLYSNQNISQNYKFNLYYGHNKINIQQDDLCPYVYEIILKNIKIMKIKGILFEFNELDNLENLNRKRLTLINYSISFIEINGKKLLLSNIVSENSVEIQNYFNQISVIDIENKIFIVQPIKEKSEYNVNFFKNYKDKIISFENNFTELLNCQNETDYKNKEALITNNFNEIEDKNYSLNLIRDNDYLDKIFEKENFDINLFWNYSLIIFFLDNKDFISSNIKIIKYYISILSKLKDEIIKKDKLKLYIKAGVIYTSFLSIFMRIAPLSNLEELEQLNLRYMIVEEREQNSIMDKVYNFYVKFVEGISENSSVFPYLLSIDSGCGYYKKELVYTFDLKNIHMLQLHLIQIFPKVIIFCNINEGDVALSESEFGGVIINENYITEFKNINYNSSSLTNITEAQKDDIAMNIFLDLFHETDGHIKFAFSEEGVSSPVKIFNKNNKLIELKYIGDYKSNDNDNEYILRNKNNKGDSGHFLELSFGKYKNELIIDILRRIKNKGKLIKRPDLFNGYSKILYDYVSLRKQIEENNINFNNEYNISIEEEIKQMENVLKNIKKEKNKNIGPYDLLININKKRKRIEENTDNNNVQNIQEKKKKLSLNSINFNRNLEGGEKKDEKKDNINYSETKPKEKNMSRNERFNNALNRVKQRFNNSELKLYKKFIFRELSKNVNIDDPIYDDLCFLQQCYIIKY